MIIFHMPKLSHFSFSQTDTLLVLLLGLFLVHYMLTLLVLQVFYTQLFASLWSTFLSYSSSINCLFIILHTFNIKSSK